MRLLHLSDLHLGRVLNGFDLIDDQRYILEQILDIAKEKNVDSILISGDIYNKRTPTESAVELFDKFLEQVSEMGLNLFAISGNHDSDVRVDFGSGVFRKNKIYIAGRYRGEVEKVTVKDEFGEVDIWLMPYLKKAAVASYFGAEKTETYNDVVGTVVKSCNIDKTRRNIILAHQFVSAGEKPRLAGSELRYESVGTLDFASVKWFDDFDYVALGHIHRPQSVGRKTVRYSGSPLKYSDRETDVPKSVPVVTLGKKGEEPEIEKVPLIPRRDMRKIKGELEKLIDEAVDKDDYIVAELTDKYRQHDARARLKQVYPNLISVFYSENEFEEDDAKPRIAANTALSFEDNVREFYRLMTDGEEISDEEMKILLDIMRGDDITE